MRERPTINHERPTTNHQLPGPVDEHSRDAVEEFTEEPVDVGRQPHFVERVGHQLQPPLARRGVDRKRHVSHPQPRVSALLHVALRPPEPADEKVAQPLLGACEIPWRIHRPENLVAGHLLVKGGNEAAKAVFADRRVDVSVLHEPPQRCYRGTPESNRLRSHS